jgi:hypothetical protein
MSLPSSARLPALAEPLSHSANAEQVFLIIRSDDEGMSHSVNMPLKKLELTYRDLIAMPCLQSIQRPAG